MAALYNSPIRRATDRLKKAEEDERKAGRDASIGDILRDPIGSEKKYIRAKRARVQAFKEVMSPKDKADRRYGKPPRGKYIEKGMRP